MSLLETLPTSMPVRLESPRRPTMIRSAPLSSVASMIARGTFLRRLLRVSPGQGDVFALRELEQTVVTALTAEAALLDATERRRRVGYQRSVEPDHAVLERLAEAQPSLQIAGVHIGDEAVLGVIGQGDSLLLGVEDDHRGDGSEDFLTQDGRIGRHIHEHRGRVEEP